MIFCSIDVSGYPFSRPSLPALLWSVIPKRPASWAAKK